jgi:hypothetical protein
MSNPTITRVGINQFWYKHWYSDTALAKNLQHDYLFTNLIQLYLNYGLLLKSNIFLHEYWYKFYNAKNVKLQYQFRAYNTFFRRFYYANDIVSIEHTFLLRNTTPEYFPMNLWFFKFTNWIVIAVNWFKPLKQKQQKDKYTNSASAINTLTRYSSKSFWKKRWKLLYIFLKKYNKGLKQYLF